jgi:hypothetical protein
MNLGSTIFLMIFLILCVRNYPILEQLKAKAHFEERKRQVMADGLDAVPEEGASTSE